MRMKIYQMLVNRVPAIQRRYHALRQQKKGFGGRVYAWVALIGMNISSLFMKKKWDKSFYYPDDGKKIFINQSESSVSKREEPKDFAKKLASYDVISFDVYDTLVFRPVSCPTDLFYKIGEKLGYLDFERLRREMEWRVRQKSKENRGTYEVTLAEIYQELEEQVGIPMDKGMQTEIETELEYCFGNPYMLEVFRYLADCGKTIICTSDMYLPVTVIKQIVENCGFTGIKQYFISCEYSLSKGDGALYEVVKEQFGEHLKYIHVGDHPQSDVHMAEKHGFVGTHYQNVNIAGMPYRVEDMSVITGSLYRGIVNSHIHNGLNLYSQNYELGFVYGGLFVLGYCKWIHEYVKNHKIDKILFLSRDGDILKQVYAKLYPEECLDGKIEYVYWSRLAATKMAAGYFKYDYLRRFLDHKVNQNYTLEQIFTSMEIEDMLQEMCVTFPGFVEDLLKANQRMAADARNEAQITASTILTGKNAWIIKEYLIKHWDEVLAHYEEQLTGGKLYYSNILKDCKRVVAVDVGWAGSGAVAMNYIVNDIWKLDCEIIGLIAGTNTIFNAEPNAAEALLKSGRLVSYLYSQEHNRDIWKWHDAAKGHNLSVELLLTSCQGSFKKFELDEAGEVKICLKEPDVETSIVSEIQKGIMDFVDKSSEHVNDEWMISGSDVYALLKLLLMNRQNSSDVAEAGMTIGI